MAKIGRNTPCPCGSGKKYKKCCLGRQKATTQPEPYPSGFTPFYTELDLLSNSVVDLIDENKLDEAEAASERLLREYPDQVDGFERLGQVNEARGKWSEAINNYQKAADFARTIPGFAPETIEYYLSKAKKMRKEKK